MNTPGLVYDANGVLTLYIQKTRPDTNAKAANWLPTPDPEFGGYETGGFQFMLRLYMSEDLDYLPPDIVKGGPRTSQYFHRCFCDMKILASSSSVKNLM